jgi:hypothetical protein
MAKSEGGPVYRFLKHLSENPDQLEAYRADPEGVMDKAGLKESHKKVIRSGDRGQIEDALRAEGLSAEMNMFCIADL